MLEEELKELEAKKTARKNLFISLLSFLSLLISIVVFFTGYNYYNLETNAILFRPLHLFFSILAFLLSFLSIKQSLIAIRHSKKRGNYFALVISVFVIGSILYELLK